MKSCIFSSHISSTDMGSLLSADVTTSDDFCICIQQCKNTSTKKKTKAMIQRNRGSIVAHSLRNHRTQDNIFLFYNECGEPADTMFS